MMELPMVGKTWCSLQPLLGQSTIRTVVEFTRLRELNEWWHWLLLISVPALMVGYIVQLYRRDTRELPRGVRFTLLLLRVVAFGGLLIFFLNLEKRTERQLTRTSRVAVLVDTSQSMGLPAENDSQSRLQQLINLFASGNFISDLRKKHDVAIYRFDQSSSPEAIATFAKEGIDVSSEGERELSAAQRPEEARSFYVAALTFAVIAILALVGHLVAGQRWRGAEGEAYGLLVASVCLIIAVVVASVGSLRNPSVSIAQAFGREPMDATSPLSEDTNADEDQEGASTDQAPEEIDWQDMLAARGLETRLGDAIRTLIDREGGGPLAGIVIATDGCNNAGVSPDSIVPVANNLEVSLFPIGFGSAQQPQSIRLVDFEAPSRAYPGDPFKVTGYLQANGLAGRTVDVSLEKLGPGDGPSEPPVRIDQQVVLGEDGTVTPIEFEVTPDEIGKRKWAMSVRIDSSLDLDTGDNQKTATIQVIERKSRTLVIAGGPMREYRFLRNLLFRDRENEVDVLLQSSPPGAAQEADNVRLEFPTTREELFEYDALVAFDPDWMKLSKEQLDLVDEWVAEQAGGLLIVAGPVQTPIWSRSAGFADDERARAVRDLYPVSFYRHGSATIQLGRVGSETAYNLDFTEDGKRAQFLWLDDSPTNSQEIWNEFSVYGYQAVRGPKPGAKVYARFSDPKSATTSELPVYMAGQFYGTGRVFYIGSGEMWRLNAIDTDYFSTFYTKLIRHVSQGRLMRDSNRGLLLVDKERAGLGETITVRASLSDAQFRPLVLEEVPASLVHESGPPQPLTLRRETNSEREGMYSGQFTATQAGGYRIDLIVPESNDIVLSRDLRVRLPQREIEQPQRNDPLLSDLADRTSGKYFPSLDEALETSGEQSELAQQLLANDQVTFLPGSPDPRFERRLMSWLMALICGALSCEWLVRRIYKLA